MFLITETHQAPQAPLPVTPDCNFKNAGPVLGLSSPAPPPSPAKQSGNQARPSCLVEISSLLGIAGRACLGAPRRCSWAGLVGLRCGGTPRCSRSWLPTPQAVGTKAAVLCNQGKLSLFCWPFPRESINDKEARTTVWKSGCKICPEAPSTTVFLGEICLP